MYGQHTSGAPIFANGAQTAAFLQMFRSAADYFQNEVGGRATLSPGENRTDPFYKPDLETGQQRAADRDMNVFGNNEAGHICSQGTSCSKFFNLVPGLSGAVGRVHDFWFNMPNAPPFNIATNVGLAVPAAVVGYGAVLGQPLQLLSTQQVINISVASSFDRDDKRRSIYGSMAVVGP